VDSYILDMIEMAKLVAYKDYLHQDWI